MGYHVSILRSAHGRQVPIALHEAQAAASELGWTFTATPPTFEFKRGEDDCTLWYNDGELWAKTPDQWEIEPMLALASKLEARVRGDEYETYTSTVDTYNHPDDVHLQKEDGARSLELLRRDPLSPEKMRYYIIGFFVALAILAYFAGKWFER
ncbi:MAG: hypothetical protein DDT34_02098 [Firmicutes bacterium]|nr:hypothetical protein [Bacillota bacterium]